MKNSKSELVKVIKPVVIPKEVKKVVPTSRSKTPIKTVSKPEERSKTPIPDKNKNLSIRTVKYYINLRIIKPQSEKGPIENRTKVLWME